MMSPDPVPFFVRCKTADVVLVTMSRNYGVQLSIALFLDIFSDTHHQILGAFRHAGAAEVDEHVSISWLAGVVKSQQKAVAKSNLITAEG